MVAGGVGGHIAGRPAALISRSAGELKIGSFCLLTIAILHPHRHPVSDESRIHSTGHGGQETDQAGIRTFRRFKYRDTILPLSANGLNGREQQNPARSRVRAA